MIYFEYLQNLINIRILKKVLINNINRYGKLRLLLKNKMCNKLVIEQITMLISFKWMLICFLHKLKEFYSNVEKFQLNMAIEKVLKISNNLIIIVIR